MLAALQDLAAWLAEHSAVLDALSPPLSPVNSETPSHPQQLHQGYGGEGAGGEGLRHRGLTERLAQLLDSGRPEEQEDYWWVCRRGGQLMLVGWWSCCLRSTAAGQYDEQEDHTVVGVYDGWACDNGE